MDTRTLTPFEEAKRRFQRNQMSHKDNSELQKRVRKAQIQMASLPLELVSLPIQAMMYSPEAEASPLSGMKKLYRAITNPQIERQGIRLDSLGRPIDEFGNITGDFDKGVLEKLSSLLGTPVRKKGLFNTPLGATWWTDNPRLLDTYMHQRGSVAVPAYLKQAPDEVMDAKGRSFSDFFLPDNQSGADFKKLLRRKNLKSIQVKNVVDPGPISPMLFDTLRRQYPDQSLDKTFGDLFMANNYLIKDPSILKFIDDFE